jgi:hypothetical protein
MGAQTRMRARQLIRSNEHTARPLPITLGLVALLAACAAPGASGTAGSGQPSAATSATSATDAPSEMAAASSGPSATVTPAEPAWTALAAAGPAAREDHTWTVDGGGATAFLFGGRDGSTVFDDLWAFDLAADTWSEITPSGGPPGRFGHEAAWVDGVGLVVFAGQAGSTFYNDLWAYDPAENAWRQLPAAGELPVPRYGSCSAIGADGRLWISHGFTSDGARFADTRAYDFASGTWADETPDGSRPVERCLHVCWVTDAGAFVLYAGQTTGVPALGDLWTLAAASWMETSGDLPPERQLAAHARLDDATLVFGGQSTADTLADLWIVDDDGNATEVRTVGEGPSARYGATLLADPERDRVLLFGGRTPERAYGDLWSLTGLPR